MVSPLALFVLLLASAHASNNVLVSLFYNTGELYGSPSKAFYASDIDFSWTSTIPTSVHSYTVRWSVSLQAQASSPQLNITLGGIRKFRVLVDGAYDIDLWSSVQASHYVSSPLNLASNNTVVVEALTYRTWSPSLQIVFQEAGQAPLSHSTLFVSQDAFGLLGEYSMGGGSQVLERHYSQAMALNETGFLPLYRLDPQIAFNWRRYRDMAFGRIATVHNRWTGSLVPPTTGDYTFQAGLGTSPGNNAGMRVWLDGVLILDAWLRPVPASSATVALVAGTAYALRVQAYSRSWYDAAILKWTVPSGYSEVVPISAFRPPAAVAAAPAGKWAPYAFNRPAVGGILPDAAMQDSAATTGLTALFYAHSSWPQGLSVPPDVTRVHTSNISFLWGGSGGRPFPLLTPLTNNRFTAQWMGYVCFPPQLLAQVASTVAATPRGGLQLSVRTFGRVRLSLGDRLLLERWHDWVTRTTVTLPFALPSTGSGSGSGSQCYPLKLEYEHLYGRPTHDLPLELRYAVVNQSTTFPSPTAQLLPGAWFRPSSGRGVKATYWFYNGHASSLSVDSPDSAAKALPLSPPATRVAPEADASWWGGSPSLAMYPDRFRANWTTELMAATTGDHHLFVRTTNCGFRLWGDGVLLLDAWAPWRITSGELHAVPVALPMTAGTTVSLTLQFYHQHGVTGMLLLWRTPGATALTRIPRELLFPAPPSTVQAAAAAVTASPAAVQSMYTFAPSSQAGSAPAQGAGTPSASVSQGLCAVLLPSSASHGLQSSEPLATAVTPNTTLTDAFAAVALPSGTFTPYHTYYGARWYGRLMVPPSAAAGATHRFVIFTITASGPFKLWVDGVLVTYGYSDPSTSVYSRHSLPLLLATGPAVGHDLRLELSDRHRSQSPTLQLTWRLSADTSAVPTTEGNPATPIPASALSCNTAGGVVATYAAGFWTHPLRNALYRGSTEFALTTEDVVRASRLEPSVNMQIYAGWFSTALSRDWFLVRWQGQLLPPSTGNYTLCLFVDDVATVTVAGATVISSPVRGVSRTAPRCTAQPLSLIAAAAVPLTVTYKEYGSVSQCLLTWTTPTSPQQLVAVPHSAMLPPTAAAPLPGANLKLFPNELLAIPPPATPVPAPVSNVTYGFSALYYRDIAQQQVVASGVTPTVDFTWGTGVSPPGLADTVDRFSARWFGSLTPTATGTHTFQVDVTDGVRLWIGGRLILDRWDRGSRGATTAIATRTSLPVQLTAGSAYAIRLEMYSYRVDATCQLSWTPPGATAPSVLGSSGRPVRSLWGHGLRAYYYFGARRSVDLGIAPQLRLEPSINFDYARTSGHPSFSADFFTIDFRGWLIPPVSGAYRFHTRSDDGARLFVDGELVVDNWRHNSRVLKSAPRLVTLTAGTPVEIRMQYYEWGGHAAALLLWSGPGFPTIRGISPEFLVPVLGSGGSVPSADHLATLPGGLSYEWAARAPAASALPVTDRTPRGLHAEFFLGSAVTDSPAYERLDNTVAYTSWGKLGPHANVSSGSGNATTYTVFPMFPKGSSTTQADRYTVSWSGSLIAERTGTHYLHVRAARGTFKLVVGDVVVLEQTSVSSNPTLRSSGQVSLTAGDNYRLLLLYSYRGSGDAVVELLWSFSGPASATAALPLDSTPTVIPQRNLAADWGHGLLASFFAGEFSTVAPLVTRVDPVVDFRWRSRPALGVPHDRFSARWEGMLVPAVSGMYTLWVASDNRARLWVGDQLVIDDWVHHNERTVAAAPMELLEGQQYPIVLEFYEWNGWAAVRLMWQPPPPPPAVATATSGISTIPDTNETVVAATTPIVLAAPVVIPSAYLLPTRRPSVVVNKAVTTVSEAGGTASLKVSLEPTVEPLGPVVVSLQLPPALRPMFWLSACVLQFNSANWAVPQTVYMGIRSAFVPQAELVPVTLAVSSPSDPRYAFQQGQNTGYVTLQHPAGGQSGAEGVSLSLRPTSTGSRTCVSWGDPHYTTFDGTRYNYYGTGDHTLLRDSQGTLVVQTRQFRCGRVACNNAVAIRSGSDVVAVGVNGTAPGQLSLLTGPITSGLQVVREALGAAYKFLLPQGGWVRVRTRSRRGRASILDVSVSAPSSLFGNTYGMCGTFDGVKGNDNQGTYPDPASPGSFITTPAMGWHQFGAFWKITDPQGSLFVNPALVLPPLPSLHPPPPAISSEAAVGAGCPALPAPALPPASEDITSELADPTSPTATSALDQPAFTPAPPSNDTAAAAAAAAGNPPTFESAAAEAEARAACASLFLTGPLVAACSHRTDLNLGSYYDSCVFDASQVGDVSLALSSAAALMEECTPQLLAEAAVEAAANATAAAAAANATGGAGSNSSSAPAAPPSLPSLDSFLPPVLRCPQLCNLRGTCSSAGTCACQSGWDGEACEIDTTALPVVASVSPSAAALDTLSTTTLVLTGSEFNPSSPMFCVFTVDAATGSGSGSGNNAPILYTPASFVTLWRATCPAPALLSPHTRILTVAAVVNGTLQQAASNSNTTVVTFRAYRSVRTYTVTGQVVTNSSSGVTAPAPAVTVALSAVGAATTAATATAVTDAQGTFFFAGLSAGGYSLAVLSLPSALLSSGYAVSAASLPPTVVIQANNVTLAAPVELVQPPPPPPQATSTVITGTVTLAGVAAKLVTVAATSSSAGAPSFTAVTDASGAYTFTIPITNTSSGANYSLAVLPTTGPFATAVAPQIVLPSPASAPVVAITPTPVAVGVLALTYRSAAADPIIASVPAHTQCLVDTGAAGANPSSALLFTSLSATAPSYAGGRVQVGGGGAVLAAGCAVGHQLPRPANASGAPAEAAALAVGASLDFVSGFVNGDVTYATAAGSVLPCTQPGCADLVALSRDSVTLLSSAAAAAAATALAAEKQRLTTLSSSLSRLRQNGGVQSSAGGALWFSGTHTDLNVMYTTAAQLSRATELFLAVPVGSTTVINVRGGAVAFAAFHAYGGFSDVATTSRLLWNLYDASSVSVDRVTLPGSLLAPAAAVTVQHSTITGTLIADSASLATAALSLPGFRGCGALPTAEAQAIANPARNQPPTVQLAAPSASVVVNPLSLTATATDADGVITSVAWAVDAVAPVSPLSPTEAAAAATALATLRAALASASQALAQAALASGNSGTISLLLPPSALAVGEYRFTATATDNMGGNATATAVVTVHSCVLDLGPIVPQFNAFLTGSLFATQSDVQGRVAVAGDAFVASYSVANNLPAPATVLPAAVAAGGNSSGSAQALRRADLIVGGRLQFMSGFVRGATVYGEPSSILDLPSRAAGDIRQQLSPPALDWAAAEQSLLQLSDRLATLPATGTVTTTPWGEITLSSADSNLAVFTLPGSVLSTATSLALHAPASASVLINVDGTDVSIANFGLFGSFKAMEARIMFNLPSATALLIRYIGLHGTVLAPRAHVRFSAGVMYGLLAARSMTGNGQINLPLGSATLPGSSSGLKSSFSGCGATLLKRNTSAAPASPPPPATVTTVTGSVVPPAGYSAAALSNLVVVATTPAQQQFAAITTAGNFSVRVRTPAASTAAITITVSLSTTYGMLSLLGYPLAPAPLSGTATLTLAPGASASGVLLTLVSASQAAAAPGCQPLLSPSLATVGVLALQSFSGAPTIAASLLVGGDALIGTGASVGTSLMWPSTEAAAATRADVRVAGALQLQRLAYVRAGIRYGSAAGTSLSCRFADCADVSAARGSLTSLAPPSQAAAWQLPQLRREAAAAAARMQAISLSLSAGSCGAPMPNTTTVVDCVGQAQHDGYSTLTLTPPSSSVIAALPGATSSVALYFTVAAAQLQSATSMVLPPLPASIADITTVIVVVTGRALSLTHFSMQGFTSASAQGRRTLLVLPDARAVELGNLLLQASLLAPRAHLSFLSGRVNGQVVARSVVTGTETTVAPPQFAGCLPGAADLPAAASAAALLPVARAAGVDSAGTTLTYSTATPAVLLDGAAASAAAAASGAILTSFAWAQLSSSPAGAAPLTLTPIQPSAAASVAGVTGAVVAVTGYDSAVAASYTLRLTVTDSDGRTASDDVTLTFTTQCALDLAAPLTSYSVFAFDSLFSLDASIAGGAAVGGAARLGTTSSVGYARASLPTATAAQQQLLPPSLVVRGRVLGSPGFVAGSMLYGDALSFASLRVGGFATLSLQVPFTAIPFQQQRARALAVSTAAAAWAATPGGSSSSSSSGGATTLTLTGTHASLNVFQLQASQLQAGSSGGSVTLSIAVPSTSSVVLNVNASSTLSLTGLTISAPAGYRQITLNLPTVTSLSLASVSLNAWLLAPNAAVAFTSGDIYGTLIVRSFSGAGSVHSGQGSAPLTPPCAAGAAATPSSSSWSTGGWGSCSAACGSSVPGVSTRSVSCRHATLGYAVAPSRCASVTAPAASQPCSSASCSFAWAVGQWGSCDRACGGAGRQSRSVMCFDSQGAAAAPTACAATAPPPAARACNTQACPADYYYWQVAASGSGSGSGCSASCGGGTYARDVSCQLVPSATGLATAAADAECALRITSLGPKPSPTGVCNTQPCVAYAWSTGAWSDTCGAANPCAALSRAVTCIASTAGATTTVADSLCAAAAAAGPRPSNATTCPADSSGSCGVCSAATCNAAHGSCQADGSCQCSDGYTGSHCTVPPGCTSGSVDAQGNCCAVAVLSSAGVCCNVTGAVVDRSGACCASGTVDVCGVCDGPATAVDISGVCCSTGLDAANLCCVTADVDACGVCGGTGASCAYGGSTVVNATGGAGGAAVAVSTAVSGATNATSFQTNSVTQLNNGSAAVARRRLLRTVSARRLLSTSSSSLWAVDFEFDIPIVAKSQPGNQPAALSSSLLQQPASPLAALSIARAPVCGNSLCEQGELCTATAAASSAVCCPADCPFTPLPCPLSPGGAECGGALAGRCLAASGTCLCNAASGHTGAACDQCLPGWAAVAGGSGGSGGSATCVREVLPSSLTGTTPTNPPPSGNGNGGTPSPAPAPFPVALVVGISAGAALAVAAAVLLVLRRRRRGSAGGSGKSSQGMEMTGRRRRDVFDAEEEEEEEVPLTPSGGGATRAAANVGGAVEYDAVEEVRPSEASLWSQDSSRRVLPGHRA